MRILALETSSRRGSVALCEERQSVAVLTHEAPNSHAERMLKLVAEALALAGWSRSSIDRIAVGCGPGSFVGIRTGIALAEGLGLGLGRPVVGIGSLQAMLWAARTQAPRRAALLDARREEFFLAAQDGNGDELLSPTAVPRALVAEVLTGFGQDCLLVGEAAAQLFPEARRAQGQITELPHALAVAELAVTLDPAAFPAIPLYVRDAGATPQHLPPSPLGTPPA